MFTIIRCRDSGKAKELLKTARKANAFIITQDKRSFQVKAHGYGYDDIEIVDYDDLKNDNYPLGAPAVIHNGDKMLSWLLNHFYNIELAGFTATLEDSK